MDDLDRYHRTLDLEPGASAEDVKRAWRDLTKVWHPDRFHGDPRMEAKAEEKLKAINHAYSRLSELHRHGPRVEPAPSTPAAEEPQGQAHEQQPPEPAPPRATPSARRQIVGVKGWLLLLCVGLTIISPLVTLGGAAGVVDGIGVATGGIRDYLVLSLAAGVTFCVWSVVAGIQLWRARPSGLSATKALFLVGLAWGLFAFVYSASLDVPREARSERLALVSFSAPCFPPWSGCPI